MLIALRFIANILFLIAAIALVSDLTTPMQGFGHVKLTPFATHWADLSPRSLKATEEAISGSAVGFLWTHGLIYLIAIPTAVLFAMLGTLFGYLGRRRKRTNIFVN